MPVVEKDHVLTETQRANPLVWLVGPFDLPEWSPATDDEILELAFGPGDNRKLKSWGHQGEHHAHWLVTRAGTLMHTDPAYSRYTHHLILRNDGWRLRGLDDRLIPPPLTPGSLYCLDTHSPHMVCRDDRLTDGKPIYKVQIAFDTDEPVDPKVAWEILTPLLKKDMRDGAVEAAKTGAAPRPK